LLELGRRDSLNTGKLQVTAVTALDDATMRQLMGALSFPRHSTAALPDHFLQWTTDSFTLDSTASAVVAGVDGEREQYATPVSIKIMPKALTVVVPAEGMRSRPVNPFGKTMALQLWRAVLGK